MDLDISFLLAKSKSYTESEKVIILNGTNKKFKDAYEKLFVQLNEKTKEKEIIENALLRAKGGYINKGFTMLPAVKGSQKSSEDIQSKFLSSEKLNKITKRSSKSPIPVHKKKTKESKYTSPNQLNLNKVPNCSKVL